MTVQGFMDLCVHGRRAGRGFGVGFQVQGSQVSWAFPIIKDTVMYMDNTKLSQNGLEFSRLINLSGTEANKLVSSLISHQLHKNFVEIICYHHYFIQIPHPHTVHPYCLQSEYF
jgi:hypothetical protein